MQSIETRGRLDNLISEIDRLRTRKDCGADPERDLIPASAYTVGQTLFLVRELADILRDLDGR